MKTFLNWIMLIVLVVGAMGFSPQAQNITVAAQSAEPPSSSESPEPLILPFAADETAELSPTLAADPAASEPPLPAPFSIHLDTSCEAWGQTARLSWSLTGELADSLGDKSELLLKLPAGLQPLEGMEIAPDGLLHLPASLVGQAVFSIQSEANETGWLDARLTSADAEQAATGVEFTPGAYARLTAEGGRLEARAMGISLEIPQGTFAAETALCISPLNEAELPTTLSGRPFQLNAFNLETGGEITRFDQYLTVQVNYNPETYTATASQLKLFYFNRDLQDWSALPTEVDEESHTLTGYTDHFTPFDIKPQSWESARLPTLDGFAVSEFTGAAAYTYPIQLPQGAGGWQPSLALTYNSQVVDGANSITQASWAGMGWSLDTGYIQRNLGENVSYYGPQDPNGSDADIRLDDDTGHDGDDTFSLVLNGQSWRLLRLPDQDGNSQTVDYRTENESFWRIRHNHAHITSGYVTDNSTWEVWDKTGNHYTFSPEARFPVGCYTPFLLTWQWPLTSAMNVHSQTITYTYSTETEVRSAASSPDCDGASTQVAIYPATISYSGYQVVFDRAARYDHKAAWDTDPDSRWQTIFFQRSRLAAIRILSQNGSNWELVRKYTLTQQDGDIFPNLVWDASVSGSKTPTLVTITEYGSDGTSALPETTFTYDDLMHLVTGSNGYGGSVTFDYAPPWYEFQTSQDPIQEYASSTNQVLPFGSGLYGDFSIYDPGQMYKIELKVFPTTAVCTAGYYYGSSGSYTYEYATLVEQEYPTGQTYKYMRWASFVTLAAKSPRFFFNCTGGGTVPKNEIKPFYAKAWPLVNRYRVGSQTATENHANTSSSTTYTYSGAASNHPANSTPGDYPLSEPRTATRGHSSVTQVGPENLAVTTWYGQGDDTSGLPLAQLTALQQLYDDFDALDTGVWSHSHYGVRQTIVREEGEPLLKMENPAADWSTVMVRNQPTLQDGESVVIEFKLNDENAEATLALTTASPNPYEYWSIHIKKDTSTKYSELDFESYSSSTGVEDFTAFTPTVYEPTAWYVLMLTAGAEKFTARIWQRDTPAVYYEHSVPFTSGKNWQFLQYINTGTLYLDDYREGPAYGLQLNQYATPQGYTPPAIVPPYLYPGNHAYTDLAVRWLPLLQSTTFSLGESGRFTGTRQDIQYDPARQGNAQYGNVTHQIEADWDGDSFNNYRMTLTGYYPTVSPGNPVVNLVGLPGFSNRYQCESATACTAANPRLLGSTWYLYDGHTGYSQAPTVGVLTGQRSLLYWGNPATPADPYYLDQDYTYDGYGNLSMQVVYNSPGSFSSRATANPHKTETIYDSQHHALPVETRAYYTTSQYYATTYGYDLDNNNIRTGLLTRITDPNDVDTTAGYDVFGRITSIVRPGDSSGTPTLRFTYNLDSTQHLFWTQVEQLISGTTYYKARKFYNGLGQLIQSQQDATLGTALQTVVTDTEYNSLGLVEKQYRPYAVGLSSGFVTPAGQYFTQTAYDDLGRVNVVTGPDATTSVLNYNIHLLNSQPASVTYSQDANDNTAEAWQDAFGRLLKSQGEIGPAVTYTYDAADRLLTALYGNALTQITYDIAGRKLTLDDPDMGIWTYAYDALSNLTRQTDARGQHICLYYDGLNRLTGKHYRQDDSCPASPTLNVAYGYDAGTNGNGQRTSMTDPSGSTAWTFDQRGRVTSESRNLTGIGTFNTAWSYNSADLLSGMQYPENNSGGLSTQVASTYHPQMTLDTLGSYVTGTTYDAAGRIISRLLGSSGLRQDFAYTAWNTQYQGGRLDTIKAGTAPNYNNLQNLDYGYDEVGNILTILDVTNSSQVQCFTYDALDRLTRGTTTNDTANGCGSTQLGNGNYDQSTTYDTATGNLSSKAGTSYGYNDTAHDHAVTHLGGVQKYWYDANGNQVTRMVGSDTYDLTYDVENRLVEVKKNNTTIATFVYDGDGNRVLSTTTTTTAFIGNHTEWEVGTGSLTRYYYAGSSRVAMRKNNTVYYLLSDHLGSTSVTTDQNGQNPVKQLYAPWGEVRYSSGSLPTKYTYTGQYSNVSDFGLMYYNARWYDNALSRWTQPDTIIPLASQGVQAWDKYAYANNNPVRWNDPTGHCIGPLILVCVGVALITTAISIAQINSGVEAVSEASAQPQVIATEQSAAQQWQDNCMGQCHYAQTAPVTPNVVIGGTRPETPVSDQLAGGYFDIVQGTIGLVGSVAGLTKIGISAFHSGPATNSTRNLEAIADDVGDWVSDGGGARVVRNGDGDFILINDSNTRQFRFDYFDPSPHENPHMHLLEWIENRKWEGPRIFPSDVDPR